MPVSYQQTVISGKKQNHEEIETNRFLRNFYNEDGNPKLETFEEESLHVSSEYIQAGFPAEVYQAKLDAGLANISSQREKAVYAAKFLATEMPKLPYFWGGGHYYTKEEMSKINPNWGTMAPITLGDDDDYTIGSMHPDSLDCSGFVTWCLTNAGFDVTNFINHGNSSYCLGSGGCRNIGPNTSITDPNIMNVVKEGDIGYLSGHVGVVVDVNRETKEVTFAHISGSGFGMNLTTMSTETGLITNDDKGVMPEVNALGNAYKEESRVGKSYFTTIISVPYES